MDSTVTVNTNYRVTGAEGRFRVQFFCSMCDFVYTSDWIEAPSEAEAYMLAEPEAKLKFNGCHKCGKWICDEHFNADEKMCMHCAPLVRQNKIENTGLKVGSIEKRNARLRYLSLTAASVAVVAIGFIAFTLANKPSGAAIADVGVPLAAPPLFDEAAKPYSSANPEGSAEGSVVFHEINRVTIPAETKDVKVFLLNPSANSCSLIFEILLDEEELYKSGPVGPGVYLEEITLSRGLPKGEYKAFLNISAHDPASSELIDAVKSELLLIVK